MGADGGLLSAGCSQLHKAGDFLRRRHQPSRPPLAKIRPLIR
jgi:hypothetical protein